MMDDTTGSAVPPVARPGQRASGGCKFCRGYDLRRSRWRSGEMWRLLALQWPMRCMHCSKRQFVGWARAKNAISVKAAHGGQFRSQETWQGYTSGPERKHRDREQRDKDNA